MPIVPMLTVLVDRAQQDFDVIQLWYDEDYEPTPRHIAVAYRGTVVVAKRPLASPGLTEALPEALEGFRVKPDEVIRTR